MNRIRLRGGLIAAALAVAGLAPQAAAAQTLAGEKFTSAAHTEAVTFEGACNPEGESTFTYYAWGYADGPVPGTMQETGTFTLASPSGPVTSFTAAYEIFGNDGTNVDGTKTLAGGSTASCSADAYGHTSFDAQIAASYDVLNPFAETGPASVSVQGVGWSGTYASTFGADPSPSTPASKDDCRNGGYARYGFKNQGECIAWVNHNT